MENRILLEGIHAMLEEIRGNMKSNPELETIKSKLSAIEKVRNDLAEKKFVTENVLAQFLVCTLRKIAEMNKKQDEKMEKVKGYILGHHKYVKERFTIYQDEVNMRAGKNKESIKGNVGKSRVIRKVEAMDKTHWNLKR